jgi:hypothetical protein
MIGELLRESLAGNRRREMRERADEGRSVSD